MRGGSLGLHIMIHGRPHHRVDKHNAQRTFYVFRVIAEQEVGDAHIHRRPTMELVHDCVVATAKGSTLPTRAHPSVHTPVFVDQTREQLHGHANIVSVFQET